MSRAHKKPGSQPFRNDDVFPYDFFTALHKGDDDEAFALIKAEGDPEGGTPSPRAAALQKSGEWDSNQRLSLVFVEATACKGKIGKDGYRFCGKPENYCNTAIHTQVMVEAVKRGWYISFGTVHGVLATPYLPHIDDGGPITNLAATRLLSKDNPFRLSKGMWQFIFDSWHAAQVEEIPDDPDDEATEFFLQKDREKTFPRPSPLEPTPTAATPKVPAPNQPEPTEPEPPVRIAITIPEPISENDESTLVAAQARPASTQTLTDLVTRLATRLEAQEEMMIQHQACHVTNANSIERLFVRNRDLEALVKRSESRQEQWEDYVKRLRGSHREDLNKHQLLLDGYTTKLSALEEMFDALQNDMGTGGPETSIPPAIRDKVQQLDNAVFGGSGVFARFKAGFIDFKEKLESGGGIECNGVEFKSQRDFLSWFEEAGPSVDIFLDGLAFMHAIRAPVVHMDDATRQLDLQMKTKITTGLENAVITSFDTVLPSILVGGGGRKGESPLGGTYAWLAGYLKTFKIWKPLGTSNGVSHQISTGVNNVSKRIVELRRSTGNSDVVMLSAGLCNDSALFCNKLVQYINEQQEELTENTIYTEEQVWAMQLECIQRIVEELSQARECMADCGRQNRGNFVWGMLKAWQVQQRLMENHFKDDPALTGVLVRRILMQGQDHNVKKQLVKIDIMVSALEDYKRQNNGEVKKLQTELTKLKEELSRLKK